MTVQQLRLEQQLRRNRERQRLAKEQEYRDKLLFWFGFLLFSGFIVTGLIHTGVKLCRLYCG